MSGSLVTPRHSRESRAKIAERISPGHRPRVGLMEFVGELMGRSPLRPDRDFWSRAEFPAVYPLDMHPDSPFPRSPRKLPATIAAVLLLAGSATALDYERDIMPLFADKCADCHSKELDKAKGGLVLDDPERFQQRFARNSVVVPGDWDASMLFISLFRPEDHDDAMPPEGKGERLTTEEVVLVQQWIAEGAPINGERGERGSMPEKGEPGYLGEPADSQDMDGDKPSPPRTQPERDWTNTEGKTIRATLLRVEDGEALLRLPGGKTYRYPVEQLSPESRKLAEQAKTD